MFFMSSVLFWVSKPIFVGNGVFGTNCHWKGHKALTNRSLLYGSSCSCRKDSEILKCGLACGDANCHSGVSVDVDDCTNWMVPYTVWLKAAPYVQGDPLFEWLISSSCPGVLRGPPMLCLPTTE